MKTLLFVPLAAALFALSCPQPPPPPPPANGFSIQTYYQEFVNQIPTTPAVLLPLVGVHASFLFNTQPTQGTLTLCTGFTDSQSLMQCPDTKIPAVWELTFTSGPCFGISDATDVDIQPGSKVGYICQIHFQRFSLSPTSINVTTPPATIQLTGDGMSSTYGMPRIQFVNMTTGEIVGTTTASSLNSNGTWLQAPTPYLGWAYSGSYVAIVQNLSSNGSWVGLGGDWVDFYGNDEPPPPPEEECGTPAHPTPCDI